MNIVELLAVSFKELHIKKSPTVSRGFFSCVEKFLPFHVDDCFQHFVADRHDFRVRLETALRDNHIRKFVRQIDVRHFQRGRSNRHAECVDSFDVSLTGVVRLLISACADFRQAAEVDELRDCDLSFVLDDAVGVRALDDAA